VFHEDTTYDDEDEINVEPDERMKNFVWLGIALKLCMDDPTKLDEIFKLNFILALNILLYWNLRDREFKKRQRIMDMRLKNKKY
jgi:hypothetical protein